jgi:spore maturation protein CgeB
MAKKILFFEWDAFMQESIEAALDRHNVDYDVFFYMLPKERWDGDDEFESALDKKLGEAEYDAVFSMNFCVCVSNVCRKRHLRYISWVYDAPVHITKTEAINDPGNDVYFFDRVQYETYRDKGAPGVHHLPLASDPDLFSDEGIKKILKMRHAGLKRGSYTNDPHPDSWYDCDVSMVGRLYKSQYSIIYAPLDDYWRGYMEGVLRSQENIRGGYILDEMFNDDVMEKLNEFYVKVEVNHNKVSREKVVYAVGTEITGRERYTILALLQNRCKVDLYSGDKDERLDKVNFKGTADYNVQMPKIFRHSKINLNISLSLIQSGIPMRALDVLACGGFLMTNYQPEIAEYFENGRELVIYENYIDLVQKVKYYLAHDDERREIARNGQRAVRERFNFDDRIKVMFKDYIERT